MTGAASLLDRLDHAVRQAVAAGEIGVVKSIRMHVSGPVAKPPDSLLALGDAIFACRRLRVEIMDGDGSQCTLCVWEQGQIGTITSSVGDQPLLMLTVLAQGGALHFAHRGT